MEPDKSINNITNIHNESLYDEKSVTNNNNSEYTTYTANPMSRKIEFDRGIPLNFDFVKNEVNTAKYNFVKQLLSILKTLCLRPFQLLIIILNIIYTISFLIIGNTISKLNIYWVFLPQLFLMFLEIIYETINYLKIVLNDRKTNSQITYVYNNDIKSFVSTHWKDIRVGHIIRLNKDEIVPADIICLESLDTSHLCYVDESSITGVFDCFKLKRACVDTQTPVTKPIKINEYIKNIKGMLKFEEPNTDLNSFSARLRLISYPRASNVTIENFIMRGSSIKNTKTIYGLVVYTGMETKIMRNILCNEQKTKVIKKRRNIIYNSLSNIQYISIIIYCLAVVSFIIISIAKTYICINESKKGYLDYLRLDYSYGKGNTLEISNVYFWKEFFVQIIQFAFSFQLFIPYIWFNLIQLSYLILTKLLYWDSKLRKRSLNTLEIIHNDCLSDFGEIKYIIADKTGTITKRRFVLKSLYILKKLYILDPLDKYDDNYIFRTDDNNWRNTMDIFNDIKLERNRIKEEIEFSNKNNNSKSSFKNLDTKLKEDNNYQLNNNKNYGNELGNNVAYYNNYNSSGPYISNKINNFFEYPIHNFLEYLCVCNSVKTRKKDNIFVNSTKIFGTSFAEEKAILQVLKNLGYSLNKTKSNKIIIEVNGEIKQFQFIGKNSYSEERQRMSVIIRREKASEFATLICKGYNILMLNLIINLSTHDLEFLQENLLRMEKFGYRFIVLGIRYLSAIEVNDFCVRYKSAENNMIQKQSDFESLANQYECNLEFLGVLFLEEEFSDDLRYSIDKISKAGIKTWVVSGDRRDNLHAVVKNLELINNFNNVVEFLANDKTDDIDMRMNNLLMQYVGIEKDSEEMNEYTKNEKKSNNIDKEYIKEELDDNIKNKKTYNNNYYSRNNFYTKSTSSNNTSNSFTRKKSVLLHNNYNLESVSTNIPLIQNSKASFNYFKKENLINLKDAKHASYNMEYIHNQINNPLENISHNNKDLHIFIDGRCFDDICSDIRQTQAFVIILAFTKGLFGYNFSPNNKNKLLKMMQKYVCNNSKVLAIGDGLNDLLMLNDANLSIGIRSKEILQVKNTCDVIVSTYSQITDLILVHGTWNLHRIYLLCFYSFYSCTLIAFYYLLDIRGSVNNIGAVFPSTNYFILMLQLLVINISIIIIVSFDQYVERTIFGVCPYIYSKNYSTVYDRIRFFIDKILFSVIDSVCIYYIVYYSLTFDLTYCGRNYDKLCFDLIILYSSYLLIYLKLVFLNMHIINILTIIVALVSCILLVCIGFFNVEEYSVLTETVFSNAKVIFTIIFSASVLLIIEFMTKFLRLNITDNIVLKLALLYRSSVKNYSLFINFNESIKKLSDMFENSQYNPKEKTSFVTVTKNLHKKYKNLDPLIENNYNIDNYNVASLKLSNNLNYNDMRLENDYSMYLKREILIGFYFYIVALISNYVITISFKASYNDKSLNKAKISLILEGAWIIVLFVFVTIKKIKSNIKKYYPYYYIIGLIINLISIYVENQLNDIKIGIKIVIYSSFPLFFCLKELKLVVIGTLLYTLALFPSFFINSIYYVNIELVEKDLNKIEKLTSTFSINATNNIYYINELLNNDNKNSRLFENIPYNIKNFNINDIKLNHHDYMLYFIEENIGVIVVSLMMIILNIVILIIYGYKEEKFSRINFLKINHKKLQIKKDQEIFDNLVPKFVQERMTSKNRGRTTLEEEVVTCLFADIVDFDSLISKMSAKEFITLLDKIYSTFDQLCSIHGLQKIETVGKTYMAAGGIKECEKDLDPVMLSKHHSLRTFELGLDMIDTMSKMRLKTGEAMKLKIGIHSREVIAAVVGNHKPQFSLIGDTVNTTARMCAYSVENCILVTSEAYEEISKAYQNFNSIERDIKGKGKMMTYLYNPNKVEKEEKENKKKDKRSLNYNLNSSIGKNQLVLKSRGRDSYNNNCEDPNNPTNIKYDRKNSDISVKSNFLIDVLPQDKEQKKQLAQMNNLNLLNNIGNNNNNNAYYNTNTINNEGNNGTISNMLNNKNNNYFSNINVKKKVTKYKKNDLFQRFFLYFNDKKKITIYKEKSEKPSLIFSAYAENKLRINSDISLLINLIYIAAIAITCMYFTFYHYDYNYDKSLDQVTNKNKPLIGLKLLFCILLYTLCKYIKLVEKTRTFIYQFLFCCCYFAFLLIIQLQIINYNRKYIVFFGIEQNFTISAVIFNGVLKHKYLSIVLLGYLIIFIIFAIISSNSEIDSNDDFYYIFYASFSFVITVIFFIFNTIRIYIGSKEYIENKEQSEELNTREQLLFNLMPPHVVRNLKDDMPVVDVINNVTILYTDICGFTDYSKAQSSPKNVVKMLIELFKRFDDAVLKNDVYKVHTIGDCYVVLGYTGKVHNTERILHEEALKVINLGKDMISIIKEVASTKEVNFPALNMRIGIHTVSLNYSLIILINIITLLIL